MSDVPPPLSALYVVFHTLVALVGWLVLGGLLATPVMMLGNAGWLSATAALVLTMVIGQAITLVPVLRRGVARGEFRPIADVDMTAIIVAQPLAMHSVWLRSLAPYEPRPHDGDQFYTAYLDFVLKGLKV